MQYSKYINSQAYKPNYFVDTFAHLIDTFWHYVAYWLPTFAR